jgi:hypothetical protein
VLVAPPPIAPGEVGAGPRTPGEVTLGLLLTVGDELPVTDPGIVPIAFGLANEPGAELNVPPVIGAGPNPGVAPNVPIVPAGALGAAVCAKHTGAAAINAAATAGTMDFRLNIRVSFKGKGKSFMFTPQEACRAYEAISPVPAYCRACLPA